MTRNRWIIFFIALYASMFWLAPGPIPTHVKIYSTALAGWLIYVSLTDIAAWIIPDLATLSIALVGLIFTTTTAPSMLPANIVASLLAWASFWLVAWGFRYLRGYEGLGMGDAKLFAAGVLWVGPDGFASVLFIASLAGLLFGLLKNYKSPKIMRKAVPFAPFLSVSIWAVWLFGPVTG